MNHKLKDKDIALVIATYNRPEDVEQTLLNILKTKNRFGAIIIVDQSKDTKTKQVVKKYSSKLPLRYRYLNIPSADISMNMGIKEAIKDFKLILTSGDDVDFLEGYAQEMAREFSLYPKVMAIGGIDITQICDFKSLKSKLNNFFLSFFFLPFYERLKSRITGAYGHSTDYPEKEFIKDAQWIPGFNTCWRREVFPYALWPEIRGYNVIDDLQSSFMVYKKYGNNSLMISPKCRTIHRESKVARYPEKKRIFVNHEDHFSFFYLHFNNLPGRLKLIWSLTGIISGHALKFLIRPTKKNSLDLKYNLEAIKYCYFNRENIKNKKYRVFLDNNLNMLEGL